MAYWAELDENNKVIRLIVVSNEKPKEGEDWVMEHYPGRWVRTSFNTRAGEHLEGKEPFRKNFGEVGYEYDEIRDAFIPPKDFESWTLNEETCQWEPPVKYPTDGKRYFWDEEAQSWIEYITTE